MVEKMLNNKNENVIGGYMKKTYTELVEEISPEEIDELYYYLEQLTEKNVSKDKVGELIDDCAEEIGKSAEREIYSSSPFTNFLNSFPSGNQIRFTEPSQSL